MSVNKRRDLQGQMTQDLNMNQAKMNCSCTKQIKNHICICPKQTAGYSTNNKNNKNK